MKTVGIDTHQCSIVVNCKRENANKYNERNDTGLD